MKPEIKFMSKVAKDIINIKINDESKMADLQAKFFDIMRKHGIKEGTKTENGRICNNFEWTMCLVLFESQISQQFNLNLMFLEVPEDLEAY